MAMFEEIFGIKKKNKTRVHDKATDEFIFVQP